MLEGIRSAIAHTDIRTDFHLPEKAVDRRGAAFSHGINGAMQAVNALAAGTPVAWFTSPAAVLIGAGSWGLGLLLGVFSSALGAKDEGKSIRNQAVASIIAGAAAAIPVYGNYVNAVAAGYNGIHFINNGIGGGR